MLPSNGVFMSNGASFHFANTYEYIGLLNFEKSPRFVTEVKQPRAKEACVGTAGI